MPVTLANQNVRAGGQIMFRDHQTHAWARTLNLLLPPDGAPVDFSIAGEFGRPSTEGHDVLVELRPADGGAPMVVGRLMVRIRKDATTLTTCERDRFLWALARLNNAGAGLFKDFRDIHVANSNDEMHPFAGFLPWHRAFLLDFERELQRIDPSVAVPYWRFDRPAPNVFVQEFMGDPSKHVAFSPSNPLRFWSTDGSTGITRGTPYGFDPRVNTPRRMDSEADTLALGTSGLFDDFSTMRDKAHATAHTCWLGYLNPLRTSVRDPVFFLLHANVDRLWAKWQRIYKSYDETDQRAFPQHSPRVGHAPGDTMWPWNQVTIEPRPPSAPGGPLALSAGVAAPGLTPRVGQMIDYQGVLDPARGLGFDYDDVPY